jgi:hypothetical protein
MDVHLALCEIIQDLTISEAYISMIGGNENTGREFQPFVDSAAYFLFLVRTER